MEWVIRGRSFNARMALAKVRYQLFLQRGHGGAEKDFGDRRGFRVARS